ncbi:DUF4328 domain-containing protein [Kribbella sandramycini]|uniref:DUF4328 domain-containing protein n=1 Tax=Kribbella sandramycini TaxID=60450 RepID=A0A7Y4NXL4_9ACTN|nr:DUF4328 domain-containing protein [Kribbella sandramycini]MBB6567365.1 putative membrane protein YeaQ/YmgE (transglycosylase-associated protein family) [Kribbella sandramycini]NOL40022.1 DUF4328 domain-containing protein [Kribbella sandramycini]
MHPAGTQPHAANEPRFRADPGYGVAASVAIVLAAAANVVSTVADWRTASAVQQFAADRIDDGRLEAVDRFTLLTTGVNLGLLLIAGTLFVIWLWRARRNAEFFCDAQHQHGRGWLIGGWCVPIASFFIPRRVVSDIAVASDPWTSPRGVWLHTRKSPEVTSWWVFWLLQAITGWLAAMIANGAVSGRGSEVVSGLYAAAVCATVSSVFCCIAAFLAIRVITMINGDQNTRPRIPWWQTPEP